MSVTWSSVLPPILKHLKCAIRVSHFISLSHSLIEKDLATVPSYHASCEEKPTVAPFIHGSAVWLILALHSLVLLVNFFAAHYANAMCNHVPREGVISRKLWVLSKTIEAGLQVLTHTYPCLPDWGVAIGRAYKVWTLKRTPIMYGVSHGYTWYCIDPRGSKYRHQGMTRKWLGSNFTRPWVLDIHIGE